MQDYRNALNKQQSSQLDKIHQRQQQERTQNQQVEIEQHQQQQLEIINMENQKDQIIANKTNSYYESNIAQIYANRHWSEQLVNDDSIFLFVLSAQGNILYCSDSCQGLIGYSAMEVVGHTISEFLHPDDQSHFYTLLDRVFETPLRLSQIDFRWKTKKSVAEFTTIQCFGYSKPDDVPSFTLNDSNHIESNYYAFFALAQVREPTTADLLVQLKNENKRLQQQLTHFIGTNNNQTPTSSSVITTWMQSNVSSLPWSTTTTTTPTLTNNKKQPNISLPSHQDESCTNKITKITNSTSLNDDNTQKKKKVYVTMEDYHCSDCGCTSSPEWRKGPLGRKTLCNACGLRWAKKNKNVNLDG